MPCPRSLRGAGPSEVAQAVRLPVRNVHLAVRRWSQRPDNDRMALDCRQSSFHHVTRVSPSHGFSVFSPFPALSACACPLALSGSGKLLTQGSPLHPSHLRWGCCMNYCGAPDAVGSQVQCFVRRRVEPQAGSARFFTLWAGGSTTTATNHTRHQACWSFSRTHSWIKAVCPTPLALARRFTASTSAAGK